MDPTVCPTTTTTTTTTTCHRHVHILGTRDAHLCMSHSLQSALESGKGASTLQIDFSAVFDRVNHQGIFYKLCSVGIGCSMLSISTQFLLNRSQHVMVDGCRSKVVSCDMSAAGQCFGPVIIHHVHLGAFSILENKLIGSTDDSILTAVVPSPGVRVTVAESLICDLGRVSKRCDL